MRIAAFPAVLVLALAACKSPADVLAEHRPKIDVLRTKLAAIVNATAAAPAPSGAKCNVPGLTYNKNGGGNLEIMQLERIKEPMVELDTLGVVQVLYSPACETALYWVVNTNHISGGDTKLMTRTFESCERATHVIVVRQVSHDRATGVLQLRYDLASIADGKILCSFESVSHGNASLGTKDYETVSVNKRTGERKHVSYSSKDEYASAMLTVVNDDVAKTILDYVGVRVSS